MTVPKFKGIHDFSSNALIGEGMPFSKQLTEGFREDVRQAFKAYWEWLLGMPIYESNNIVEDKSNEKD